MLDASQQICLFLDRPASRLHGSRGCLGCCSKPTPIIAVDEPSKGLKIQGRTIKKTSVSEDFWSTSTHEMENSGVQSQRSISSISTSMQNLDHHGAASTSNPSEFVNHGLLLWNQTRLQWTGNRRPENRSQQVREPRLRKLSCNWKKRVYCKFLSSTLDLLYWYQILQHLWLQLGCDL
uniref:Uncharacterized protein LOC105033975 isoform X2 n=1 Tax=Elaeis guineensis var. tenera TaxID=51953 RepID=A0A8N4ER76_ELAGV|nr:uncharacterized protein LOC105033975 isoform X2 [Elaeis guineensis]